MSGPFLRQLVVPGCALLVVLSMIFPGCTETGSWDQLTADLAALDWVYRIPLAIDNTGTTSTSSGVVGLARLTPERFPYEKLKSSGDDIGFFDEAGRELPFEVEYWNFGGESRLWVRIPEVAADGSSERIWLYFGSRGKTGRRDANAVWDSTFAGVWHISPGENATGRFQDSSGNGNHLSNGFGSNTPYGLAPGILGAADAAVGQSEATDALVAAATEELNNLGPLTFELWFKDVNSLTGNGARILSKGPIFLWINSAAGRRMALTVSYSDDGENDGVNLFRDAVVGWTLDNWLNVAVTWDGGHQETGVTFFADGVDAGFFNGNDAAGARNDDSGYPQFVGNSAGGGADRAPGAHLDEIRISTVVRSPSWLLLSYRGASDQLFTFGAVEEL